MIPYGRQSISEEDIQAVVDVLRSDFLTQGPAVPAFENALAKYCHADNAVVCNSGTSALHIACLALGLGPGDYLWTSPISFVASANCALYCGAKVDFVDIEPDTGNMDADLLEEKLVESEKIGLLPKVVIPVHYAGLPCDMEKIHGLAKRYGFYVIEDACHALGAHYHGEPVGNCRYSDVTVFSFHPVKSLTTIEGGALLTNSPKLAEAAQLFRSHGITRDTDRYVHGAEQGAWYYEQQVLGFNYRMSDVQAALGMSQMSRLDSFVRQRREVAEVYSQALNHTGLQLPKSLPERDSAYHLYTVRVKGDAHPSRRQLFDKLRDAGIAVNVHYIPIYLQPYFQSSGFRGGYCPNAEEFYSTVLSIPIFPRLSRVDQDYVIAHLEQLVMCG